MPVPFDDTGEHWRRLTPEQFELCRHAREVNDCIGRGYAFTRAHIEGVAEKRGKPAASKLWRDVKAYCRPSGT